ncbi:hypothetical protein MGAST_14500 [Mycobacterium gastri 'Wayne']|uniref:acetolactate synthase n=1 Tax=Mycobacterium gastri TaxID=1777 RepID=A0A1X1W1K6_MYCGS|nr:hypothetical protein MGAST_14500 [Mycobacterium gastri 'Wayne']ORV80123.1 hypothetical protein AWC07_21555 [Mycobacterium gastri]
MSLDGSTTSSPAAAGLATGGQLAARTLASFGVRSIFGVHGGHLDSFLVECQALGMRIIDHRHEASAGNAAEGYAHATGGLAVAFATAGPGFANAFSSLCNAAADRLPTLLITSSPPLRETELNVLQDAQNCVQKRIYLIRLRTLRSGIGWLNWPPSNMATSRFVMHGTSVSTLYSSAFLPPGDVLSVPDAVCTGCPCCRVVSTTISPPPSRGL